jgi:hypothetical protein
VGELVTPVRRAAGGDAFLQKPYGVDALEAAAARLLGPPPQG